MKIAVPGKTAIHHAYVAPRATDKIDPQDTAEAEPKPKKLNPDSVKIAEATPNAAITKTGAIAFGRTCTKMIRKLE